MMAVTHSDMFLNGITESIRVTCEKIIAEESEKAAERTRQRLNEIAPQLVMALFSHFDVSRNEQRIVITVKDSRKSA